MSDERSKDQVIKLSSMESKLSLGGNVVVTVNKPEEPLLRKGAYLVQQMLGSLERGQAAGLLPADLKDYELVDDPSGIRLSLSLIHISEPTRPY